MIETIEHEDKVIAIIIYKEHTVEKNHIEFISPQDYSLQLGFMNRPTGYEIQPHLHNPIKRETTGTQEVLFIKEGKVLIEFYSYEQTYLEERELSSGDFILLCGAGHGISILETATILEVKNGPYIEDADKVRFERKKRKD